MYYKKCSLDFSVSSLLEDRPEETEEVNGSSVVKLGIHFEPDKRTTCVKQLRQTAADFGGEYSMCGECSRESCLHHW